MVTRWRFLATVLGVTIAFAACAQGEVTGLGGNGGTVTNTTTTQSSTSSSSSSSTSSGTGGASSSSSSSSSSSGGGSGGSATSDHCGQDGGIFSGDECNGTNLGGATCVSLGFESGTLVCNLQCNFDTSGCVPLPNCLDPMQSCQDPGCVGKPGCVDACTPALPATCPTTTPINADNTARPTTENASCTSATPGPEEIFTVTASQSGVMVVDVTPSTANYSVSVRTACASVASELGCSNTPNQSFFGDFVVGVPVTSGQTYFVVVQGMTPLDVGPYTLTLSFATPETICNDFIDNDFNGYVDCDDTNCQNTSTSCVPGTIAIGQACSQNPDCAAAAHNPVCLDANDFPAFSNGYCSQFCDTVAQNCPTGNVCYGGLHISKDGVCLQSCTANTDCRASEGYACVDRGLSTKVCAHTPEILCDDYIDNDFNGLMDCADPNCQTLPACVPGTTAVGQPCSLHSQCTASTGLNNPFCIDAADESYPKGYCSHWCDPTKANDCGTGNVCVMNQNLVTPAYVCMVSCTQTSQCRTADGYTCTNGVCDAF